MTTELLDCRGLKCPLPVLKLEKRLAQLPSGGAITLLATDPVARIDIQLLCRQGGHACELDSDGDVLRFAIVKR